MYHVALQEICAQGITLDVEQWCVEIVTKWKMSTASYKCLAVFWRDVNEIASWIDQMVWLAVALHRDLLKELDFVKISQPTGYVQKKKLQLNWIAYLTFSLSWILYITILIVL